MRDKVIVGFGARKWSRKWRRIVLVKEDYGTAALCRNQGWLPIVVIEPEAKIEFPPKLPDGDKVILLVKTSERRSYSCIQNDPDIPSKRALAGGKCGHCDVAVKQGGGILGWAELNQ